MALGDIFRRLFGQAEGGATAAVAEDGIEHQGYTIVPQPTRQGSQFGTAGLIVKGEGEARREHRFVRADTHASLDEARQFTIQKAKRLIDEQGESLFER